MVANRRDDTCSKIFRGPIRERTHVARLLGPIRERIHVARLSGANRREDTWSKIIGGQ